MKNIWEWLEISPTTDKAEIKKAYAAQSKKYHPEDHPEEFAQLRKAYKLALVVAGKESDKAQEPIGLQESMESSDGEKKRELQQKEQREGEQWYEEVKSQAEERWDAAEEQYVSENEDILEDENVPEDKNILEDKDVFSYEFQEEEKLDQEQQQLYHAFLWGMQELVIGSYAAELMAWKMLFSWYQDKIDIRSKKVLDTAVLIFYPGCALPEYVWKFLYKQFFVDYNDTSIQQYVVKLNEARYMKLGPVWQRTRQLTLKDFLKQAIPLYGAAEKRNIAAFLFGKKSLLYEDYSKKVQSSEKIMEALILVGCLGIVVAVFVSDRLSKTEEEGPSYYQTYEETRKYLDEMQDNEYIDDAKEELNDAIYTNYTKESPYICDVPDWKQEVSGLYAQVYYDSEEDRYLIETIRPNGTEETVYVAEYFWLNSLADQIDDKLKMILMLDQYKSKKS